MNAAKPESVDSGIRIHLCSHLFRLSTEGPRAEQRRGATASSLFFFTLAPLSKLVDFFSNLSFQGLCAALLARFRSFLPFANERTCRSAREERGRWNRMFRKGARRRDPDEGREGERLERERGRARGKKKLERLSDESKRKWEETHFLLRRARERKKRCSSSSLSSSPAPSLSITAPLSPPSWRASSEQIDRCRTTAARGCSCSWTTPPSR